MRQTHSLGTYDDWLVSLAASAMAACSLRCLTAGAKLSHGLLATTAAHSRSLYVKARPSISQVCVGGVGVSRQAVWLLGTVRFSHPPTRLVSSHNALLPRPQAAEKLQLLVAREGIDRQIKERQVRPSASHSHTARL